MHPSHLPARLRGAAAWALLTAVAMVPTAMTPVAAAPRAAASVTFTVNAVGDAADAKLDGTCQTAKAGECTLRAALQEANAAGMPVAIAFAIAGATVRTIAPSTQLPALNNPNGITIDGFTQPGASPNTDALVVNATYRIELKGAGATGFNGLVVNQSNNTIRGLVLHGFHVAIDVNGANANRNTIVGNTLGLTPTGALDPGYGLSNASSCLVLENGASYNQIGAPGAANRNVVSGCNFKGIATYNYPTNWNKIQNNIIGLDPTGTQRRATVSHGIDITRGSEHTLVGGSGVQEGNLVSGNAQAGIEIAHMPSTQYNSVIGNLIGTDPTGNSAPAYASNGYWGVHLEGKGDCGTQPCTADQNHETVASNVIVNSGRGGVMVDKGTNNSLITANKIGVTANGTAAGNKLFGVNLNGGAFRITVSNNVIAYNDTGVQIQPDQVLAPKGALTNTNQNTITQNSLYANGPAATPALGIDLTPLGTVNTAANASAMVNDAVIAPTLSNATPTSVQAQTCANCVVELFLADGAAGAVGSGKTYLATGTADATGKVTITLTSAVGKIVTATATNPNGSTSEFARNVQMPNVSATNKAPTAKFSATCNGLACSFDGTKSTDADGSILSYTWNFGDGSPVVSGAAVQRTFAAGSTYAVTLTVMDNGGKPASQSQQLTVTDLLPIASFIGDCSGLTCSFDASSSSDPDNGTLTFAWNFGDGTTSSDPQPTRTYASPGQYTVGVTVNDGQGGTTSTTQVFNVAAPNAGLVASDSFTHTVASGWGSADVGGAYAAAQGTTTGSASVGGGVGKVQLTTAASGRGFYLPSVSLLDTDAVVDFATDSAPAGGTWGQVGYLTARRVTANTEYRARLRFMPSGLTKLAFAKTVGSTTEVAIGAETTLASVSYSPGQMYRIRFDVSGTNPTTLRARVWLVGSSEPSTWALSATDSEASLQTAGSPGARVFLGASATNQPTYLFDNLAITNLGAINQPPTASFTGSCTTLSCSFDGSASTDPDGTVASYSWDFGDGAPLASGSTASHNYSAAGNYIVTLTVTDNGGATGTTSQQFAPVAAGGVIAQDSFNRTVGSGWGSADLGGAYAAAAGGGATTVNGSCGTFSIASTTGAGGGVFLPGASALNTDAVIDVSTSVDPAGGTWGQVSYLTLRRSAANTEYRARLRFVPGGAVKLAFVKTVGTTSDVAIGSEVTVPGLSYVAGRAYSMRFDVTGTNPTTLQARVWQTGTPEPVVWNVTATDGEPALQSPGKPGVRVFLGANSTAQPLWQFDNFTVTDLG